MKAGVKPPNQPGGPSKLSFWLSLPPAMVLPVPLVTASPASVAFGACSSTKRPHKDLRHLLEPTEAAASKLAEMSLLWKALNQQRCPCFGRPLAAASPALLGCQERVRAKSVTQPCAPRGKHCLPYHVPQRSPRNRPCSRPRCGC